MTTVTNLIIDVQQANVERKRAKQAVADKFNEFGEVYASTLVELLQCAWMYFTDQNHAIVQDLAIIDSQWRQETLSVFDIVGQTPGEIITPDQANSLTFWGVSDMTDDSHVLLSFAYADGNPHDFLLPLELVELPIDELGTLTWIGKYLDWRKSELGLIMERIGDMYRISTTDHPSAVEKLQHIAASLGYKLVPNE